MARPFDMNRMISRRALLLGGVQLTAGVGLLSRLYYLQFVRGAEFATLAEDNRIKVQLLIPPRGLITDRNGVAMAMNQVNFRLMLGTDNRRQAKESLQSLADLLQLRAAEQRDIEIAINRMRGGLPVLVREHLPWDAMATVEYHLPTLPGVFIEEGQWRHYPFADHASHLIGYVGKVAKNETDKSQPLLQLPDMKVGKNGLEYAHEETLRGVAGARQVEVNVIGAQVRELKKNPPQAGDELKLTIDSRLQEFCVQRLGEESGGIVVMDARQGDVLALVSMPAFDPNEFSKGITDKYWKKLNANEKNPLLNKAISGQYPPGSTFKMVTGLAGLKSGKFSSTHRVHCPGYYMLGNHRFGCWKVEGHGSMNMAEAIEQSCDTYFYTVAREVGIDAVAAMGNELGVGVLPELGLRGEKAGIMPSPAWKKKARGVQWNPGETINTAIGQGDTLMTPLQLAIMTARLVNGGNKIYPRLTRDQPVRSDGFIDIDPSHLELMLDGMTRVTNAPRGTAYAAGIREEAFRYGGKTGTAQVRHLSVVGQDQKKLPWLLRHHALFVGFAPVGDPRYVCGIIIEHGGGGASTAAPIARDVMQKVQELMA
jgi:penicillin-binding protein 2